MSVFIFEGVDNTGKSTQIKLLTNYLMRYSNNVYIEHCNSNTTLYDYISQFKKIQEYGNQLTRHFILDRSYIGEFVYKKLYRNGHQSYFDLLKQNEKKYINPDSNIFLFLFEPELNENFYSLDDGLSIGKSNNSYKTFKEKTEIEINEFKTAFDETNINNKFIIPFDPNKFNEDITHLKILKYSSLH